MFKEYEIRGLRIEKFIQKISEADYIENERYIFNCISSNNNYEITVFCDYINNKEKKSVFEIQEVKHFIGTSYLPLKRFTIKLDEDAEEYYNHAFILNDETIKINFEAFNKTNRAKEIRPVWIFEGKSGLGKTYLSSLILNNSKLTVYETDICSELPNVLYEDIIVVGNKYKFSLDEIEKKIYGEHESIIMNFDKKEKEMEKDNELSEELTKEKIMRFLDAVEEKYSDVPQTNKEFGVWWGIENPNCNYKTHPGTYAEIKSFMKYFNFIVINDYEVGMKIVDLSPSAFMFLSEELRNNKAIFMNAIKNCRMLDYERIIESVGEDILNDNDCLKGIIKKSPILSALIRKAIKKNPEVMTEYVKTKGEIPAWVVDSLTPELYEQVKPYFTYKIEGMRIENYIGEVCEGHNLNFEYYDKELEKYILFCSKGDKKFAIDLYKTYGECPSGWTTASWGNMDIREVEEFEGIEFKPCDTQEFELIMEEDGFFCPIFEVSYYGGDRYYPYGSVGVDFTRFTEVNIKDNVNDNCCKEHYSKELSEKLETCEKDDIEAMEDDFYEEILNQAEEKIILNSKNNQAKDLLREYEKLLNCVKRDYNE